MQHHKLFFESLTRAGVLFLVLLLVAVVVVRILLLDGDGGGLLLGISRLDGVAQPLFEPLTVARDLAEHRV